MNNLSEYIIEKFRISKNIKLENENLALSKWITYIRELGGNVSSGNKSFYRISLNEYKGNSSPELTIYVARTSPTPKFWRACMPQEIRTYYSKDIYIVYSKDGDDKEYYINKDSLDKSERGWTFTKHNAEVIIDKLKEIDDE